MTESDYQKKIDEEGIRQRERKKVHGVVGALKYALNPKNWARGAAINSAESGIAGIEQHAAALSRINHAQVDAGKLNDSDSQSHQLREAGLRFLNYIPGASARREAREWRSEGCGG